MVANLPITSQFKRKEICNRTGRHYWSQYCLPCFYLLSDYETDFCSVAFEIKIESTWQPLEEQRQLLDRQRAQLQEEVDQALVQEQQQQQLEVVQELKRHQ